MSRLILIGLPGSGKTTLGRMAAQALALPFYDCDDRVSRAAGMTIPDIFARRGEPYFRALEREALQELCRREDCVIATGGGVVLDEANCYIMRGSGRAVYLEAPLAVLVERLKAVPDSDHRPALTDLPLAQEMGRILRERQHLYKSTAMAAVDASLPENEVMAAILRVIGEDK